MKKLILLLLFTCSMYAQDPYVYFGATADLRNLTIGSDATKSKSQADLLFKFGMTGQGFEVAIGYEHFPALDFERYLISVGKMIQVNDNLTLVPSIEPSLIGRYSSWGGGLGYEDVESSHLTVGLAMPIRYSFNDSLALEGILDAIIRTDDMAKYGDDFKVTPSFRLGIVYKIQIK